MVEDDCVEDEPSSFVTWVYSVSDDEPSAFVVVLVAVSVTAPVTGSVDVDEVDSEDEPSELTVDVVVDVDPSVLVVVSDVVSEVEPSVFVVVLVEDSVTAPVSGSVEVVVSVVVMAPVLGSTWV